MLRISFALMCLMLLGASVTGCHASGSIGHDTSADLVAR